MLRKPCTLGYGYSKLFSHETIRNFKYLFHNGSRAPYYLFRTPDKIPKKFIPIYLKEYKSICSLLRRSGIRDVNQLSRNFSTTGSSHNSQDSKDPNDPKKKPENDDEKTSILLKAIFWLVGGFAIATFLTSLVSVDDQPEVLGFVAWNEFIHHMLAKGEVEKIIVKPDLGLATIIVYEGAVIKNRKIDRHAFFMKLPDAEKFEEKLREAERKLGIKPGQEVQVIFERDTNPMLSFITNLIIIGWVLSLIFKSKAFKGSIKFSPFDLRKAKFTLIDPLVGQGKGVRFSDVAGLKEAKQEVMEFVDYLKRPEHYQNLGAKVPKGALLLGPPGCGKTLLAKAVATESNVPFLSMNGSEFIELIGGLGAARVRDLFKEARKRSPCIIYVDEIDAIGKKRSTSSSRFDGATGEGEQTLNQLLVEMDGMASKEGVLLLASTNRADVLDKALLRPGRFDRHILIDLPTMEERKEIFEHHLKSITLENSPIHYSKRMAYLTPGFSGADIANVCNEAALHAARLKKSTVQGGDLEYAVERVVGGTEKRSSAITPEEKKMLAYHEAGHAVIGWMLEHADALLKVTIVPRSSNQLGSSQFMPNEHYLFTKEELFDKMCMALGGRAAETIMFNKATTNGENDLKKVTKIAYAKVRQYGMNDTVGLLSFTEEQIEGGYGRKPYSKVLANLMDEESSRLVARAFQKAEEVLQKNKDKLIIVAEALLKQETLNYDDIEKLIGPPPHGKKNKIDPIQFELSIKQAAGPEPPPKEEPKPRTKERENRSASEEFSQVNPLP